MKKKEKETIKKELEDGSIDIIIGTHALLEDDVVFKKLGLVVTDEQHRFGVKQKEKIISKGLNPNTLVMSATPIPRSLALVMCGDLDISYIDELPSGRLPIKTIALIDSSENKIDMFLNSNIKSGRQAYVVCPLVEEKEDDEEDERPSKKSKGEYNFLDEYYADNKKFDLKSVEAIYKRYKKRFPKYNVAFIHGKMKEQEKDDIMLAFKNNKIQILVSTTVIEVGVDVANANIMVIENAERFGLAQLHQLRGRIGRGKYQSYCILKTPRNKKQKLRSIQKNHGYTRKS